MMTKISPAFVLRCILIVGIAAVFQMLLSEEQTNLKKSRTKITKSTPSKIQQQQHQQRHGINNDEDDSSRSAAELARARILNDEAEISTGVEEEEAHDNNGSHINETTATEEHHNSELSEHLKEEEKIVELYQTSSLEKNHESNENHTEEEHGEDGIDYMEEEGHVKAGEHGDSGEHEVHVHQADAVLFPFVAQVIGIFCYFFIIRCCHFLPYTAMLFVIGIGVGMLVTLLDDDEHTLAVSTKMWSNIDSHVLLFVFLPGLMFKDALGVNFHLFCQSIGQVIIMAFPMVLAGTSLMAAVAYYIFPYGWSVNLCMTFGAILAATDPVAVAALLNEVGAPPRLKMHISGESMFNDGSAIVFFNVFKKLFLAEIPGYEVEYPISTVSQGIIYFLRLALGGAFIGLVFAIALVYILHKLDRKLNAENNVVQVTATVVAAYLSFFVSERMLEMSGVLATVMCGIFTRAFGGSMINDPKMMDSFWTLLEHLLNTLLFTLGGVVWGKNLIKTDGSVNFSGIDWMYLIILYIFVQVLRFALMFLCFPVLSRIGLKTTWQETTFLSYGGLRGAVGIALALAIDNEVAGITDDPEIHALTSKLFGMVGGVALMTLVINGSTSASIIKALGLTDVTKAREQILKCHRLRLRDLMKTNLGNLLCREEYQDVPYKAIACNSVFITDITDQEVQAAIGEARKPGSNKVESMDSHTRAALIKTKSKSLAEGDAPAKATLFSDTFQDDNVGKSMPGKMKSMRQVKNGRLELRLVFLDLLRGAYSTQVESGALDARENNGFIYATLIQSVENATDRVNNGGKIRDWNFVTMIFLGKFHNRTLFRLNNICAKKKTPNQVEQERKRYKVLRALAFIQAHKLAQEQFKSEILNERDGQSENMNGLGKAGMIVLEESDQNVKSATKSLKDLTKNEEEYRSIQARNLAILLLNQIAQYVEDHLNSGILSLKEAEHYLEEIDHAIIHCQSFATEDEHFSDPTSPYQDDEVKFEMIASRNDNKTEEFV